VTAKCAEAGCLFTAVLAIFGVLCILYATHGTQRCKSVQEHVSPFVGQPVRFVSALSTSNHTAPTHILWSAEGIGKAMKKGGDLQEYLYAAIMLPATQLEVAKDLMGTAMLLQSSASMAFVADC